MLLERLDVKEVSFKSTLFERLWIYAPSRKGLIIWCLGIFALGAAFRIALLFFANEAYTAAHSEALHIAVTLATTGNYADAYGPASGPTAHCAPLHPLLMAALFHVLGVYTPAAVIAMHLTAAFASALAFALLPALAIESGLPLACGVLAGLAGALLPLNFWFQVYASEDAPFTAAALVALCILACCIRRKNRFRMRGGAVLGMAAGFASLLNPVVLPIVIGWLIIMVVENRRKQLPRMIAFFGVSIATLVAALTPWAIRNYEALGALIWTRSDFWLEMHVSNNDLLTADEQRNFQLPGYVLLHPTGSPIERAKVKRLGEVAYSRIKRKQVLSWIATHKRRFLNLTAERFRLFWIPRMKRPLQSIGEAILTILGLSGLVLLFRARAAHAWILGAVVVLFPGVYYFIQVSPRYRFPLEPFLFLLSGYFVVRIASAVTQRRTHAQRHLLPV